MSLNVETPSLAFNAIQHSHTSSITQAAEGEEVRVVVSKNKIELEEALGNFNSEDDWENDPENARNWSFGRKWTAIAIVSTIFFLRTFY